MGRISLAINFEAVDTFQAALERKQRMTIPNALEDFLRSVANDSVAEAQEYPPLRPRSIAREVPYYQRGVGMIIAGKRKEQIVDRTRLSQNLKDKWRVGIGKSEGHKRVTLSITNLATYAGLVMGQRQRPLHASTGWKKMSTIIKKHTSKDKLLHLFGKITEGRP